MQAARPMNLDTARSGIKTKAYEHLHARMRNGKVNAVASLFSVVVLSKHGQVEIWPPVSTDEAPAAATCAF